MTKKQRTNKIILLDVEKKIIEYDVILNDLKKHFDNHLSDHEEKLREERRYHKALIIVAIGAFLTAGGSLIVGLILLGLN